MLEFINIKSIYTYKFEFKFKDWFQWVSLRCDKNSYFECMYELSKCQMTTFLRLSNVLKSYIQSWPYVLELFTLCYQTKQEKKIYNSWKIRTSLSYMKKYKTFYVNQRRGNIKCLINGKLNIFCNNNGATILITCYLYIYS